MRGRFALATALVPLAFTVAALTTVPAVAGPRSCPKRRDVSRGGRETGEVVTTRCRGRGCPQLDAGVHANGKCGR